jgi:FdhD protein
VHSCALCQNTEVLIAIEDVGRHNAADIISGLMWLDNLNHKDFIFYTTGRVTSEIVRISGSPPFLKLKTSECLARL